MMILDLNLEFSHGRHRLTSVGSQEHIHFVQLHVREHVLSGLLQDYRHLCSRINFHLHILSFSVKFTVIGWFDRPSFYRRNNSSSSPAPSGSESGCISSHLVSAILDGLCPRCFFTYNVSGLLEQQTFAICPLLQQQWQIDSFNRQLPAVWLMAPHRKQGCCWKFFPVVNSLYGCFGRSFPLLSVLVCNLHALSNFNTSCEFQLWLH